MFDTIHIRDKSYSVHSFPHLTDRLVEKSYYQDAQSNRTYINYSLDNLKVTFTETGLNIKGSLAKFYYGSNLKDLDCLTTQLAINKLEDNLQLDLSKAIVTKLDFGCNLDLDFPVQLYLNQMENARYYQTSYHRETKYYSNSKKRMLLYDKVKECKQKRVFISTNLVPQNLLRYELRFEKSIHKQLKRNEPIRLYDLANVEIYNTLLTKWKQEFQRIKFTPESFNQALVKTPKNFIEYLAAYGIQYIGQQEIDNELKKLKQQGFTSVNSSRTKQKIRTLLNKYGDSESNTLMEELTQKILNIK